MSTSPLPEVFDVGLPGVMEVDVEEVSEVGWPPEPNLSSHMPRCPQKRSSWAGPPRPTLDTLAAELEELMQQQHKELMLRLRGFISSQQRQGIRAATMGSNVAVRPFDAGVEVRCIADRAQSLDAIKLRQVASATTDEKALMTGQPLPMLRQQATAQFNEPSMTSTPRGEHDVCGTESRASLDSNAILADIFGTVVHANRLTRKASMDLSQREKRGTDHRSKLLRMTSHWMYELANACLIFINALLIAWETDHDARHVQKRELVHVAHFAVLMYVFCFIFVADLALRVLAQGSHFFYSMDWRWNWFDIMVVISSVTEVTAFLVQSDLSWLSNASALRVVRVVRVMRLARVARLGRALRSFSTFRDFRITIAMLCDSVVPMLTFSSIMAMILMVFAIFFTDGATGYIAQQGDSGVDEDLVRYWGGVLVTMSTLYKSISGGVDWENAVRPLHELSWPYMLTFYLYVSFSFLAMLNVISAMFINKTLQITKNDRDFVAQNEMQGMKEFMSTLDMLFEELDYDQSGTISLAELQDHIMDPKVNAYFRAIDLNVYKVKELFKLVDVDNSGGIDRKEFAQGCIRLRGAAKKLDVDIMQQEMKALSDQAARIKSLLFLLADKIDEKFEAIADVQGTSPTMLQKPSPPPRAWSGGPELAGPELLMGS